MLLLIGLFSHFPEYLSLSFRSFLNQGVTYQASDRQRNIEVALKMEKQDKARKILKSEYDYLVKLRNFEGIIQVYDFVD